VKIILKIVENIEILLDKSTFP